MPAESTAQRRAIAIAKHHPRKLYKRNKGLLKMRRSDMHDFAATSERGLPHYKGRKGRKKRGRMRVKRRSRGGRS